uniref:Uncharacterized protein n=1 Tax=Scophthalmus maximus TaxID=52904 RepID=A0A8D3CM46_SCOMX
MTVDLDQTPRSLLVFDRSSFLDEKNRISSQVEQHHFNYKVSVLLPECSSAPSHLDSVLNSFKSFYLIRNMPIYELLDKHFLETAAVYGLSYRTRVDEDNCVALMPNGRLCLSLDKDSFQVLGVEGKPSRFNHRTNSRYVVSVDLTHSSMAPGGRGYVRLLTGLRSRLHLKTDFLLSHHPGGGASLQHRPEIRSRVLTQLSCPALLTSDLQSSDPHSFLEWLGAVDADAKFFQQLPVVPRVPEPSTTLNQALSVSVCGLLLPQDIHRLIQEIRRHLEHHLESWASLTVHGFVDSPVSWGDSEHGVMRGGENFYSLLMFHDHTYHLHQATGAHDTCPP